MAIHEVPAVWHDLLEDPNDLPKVAEMVYFCMIRISSMITLFKSEVYFQNGRWMMVTERKIEQPREVMEKACIQHELCACGEGILKDTTVVAWCEGYPVYYPRITMEDK